VWQAFYRENAIKNNAHKEAEKYQALFTGSVVNYMFADFFQALNKQQLGIYNFNLKCQAKIFKI